LRTKQVRLLLSTIALALFAVAPALAQRPPARPRKPPKDRGFIGLSAGVQAIPVTFSDDFTYPVNAEDAQTQARYRLGTAIAADATVGVHFWKKRAGAAVSVTRTSGSARAAILAQVPHPFFDNQHREVSGEADGVERTETAVHVDLYYLRTTGKLRLMLTAGPTWFNVEQQLTTSVSVDETYPYDTAAFRDVGNERVTASAIGGNIGADVSWMFSPSLGAGVLARYARGSVRLNAVEGHDVPTDAGGLQIGVGVRIKF
jgi:hypothetical protein